MSNFLKIFGVFMCLFAVVSIAAANKYDRVKNRPNDFDPSNLGKEFKSRQITQTWQKAHRMQLSKDKLSDLHRELIRLDSMYYKAKKDGAGEENNIRRSETEITVDRQLRETMRKYGMAGNMGRDEQPRDFKVKPNTKYPVSDDMPFSDRKISQLWVKAQKSKMFSEAELEELKKELSAHQDKMDDFNTMMEEIHGPDGSKANTARRFDNKNPDEIAEMRKKDMELKLKHREISREFQKLSAKTIPEEERGPFTDNRVITLWREARGQDFSDDDLAQIMEELKAFEEKINEHEETHEEALRSDLTLGGPGKNLKDKNRPLKDRSIMERAKELGRNVNDKMKALRHKISQGGSWTTEL